MTRPASVSRSGAVGYQLPGPELRFGSRRVPAFRLLALSGVGVGIAFGLVVAEQLDVTRLALLLTAALAVLASLGLIALRAARGPADWVWHEHEAAVLAAACLVGLVGPVGPGGTLALLDATMTALLVVLGVGRIGCMLAGCCHGRAVRRTTRYAVCYGPAYREAGLRRDLIGVPLIAVQALEALVTLLLAGVCLSLSLGDLSPGVILVVAFGGRAGLRLVLELWRGDRPTQTRRLSTPQRWSLAAATLLLALSATAMVPVGTWTTIPAAAAGTALAIACFATDRESGRWPYGRTAGLRRRTAWTPRSGTVARPRLRTRL